LRQLLSTLLLAITLALSVAACGDGEPAVSLTGLLPATGAVGDAVDLVGEGFTRDSEGRAVHFGGLPAQVSLWQDRRVRVTVPAGLQPGLTVVVLSVGGVHSNELAFVVE
jgi:hypothetical protein